MKSSSKQSGMALIIAMMLLTVLTIIGMSAGRTSNIQERMAANFIDRSNTFQVAQEALKYAEIQIDGDSFNTVPVGEVCAEGILNDVKNDQEERFRNGTFQCWKTVTQNIALLGAQPQYYIELLGSNAFASNAPCSSNKSASSTCDVYRITVCSMPARNVTNQSACSSLATDQSVVYLRSIYMRKRG